MIIPFTSQAERSHHFKHRHTEQKHNNSYFWQDVERRQHKQERRIERGVDKGQLTRREAKKLHREQRHVAKQIRRLARYNYISRQDKRDVMEHLDYVSEKIRILKHNQNYVHRKAYRYEKSTRHIGSNHRDRNDRYVSFMNEDLRAGIYFRF